jgi:hypothetical protein
MSDAELVKHCMCGCMYLEVECPNCNKVTDTDRIEALTAKLAKAVELLIVCRDMFDEVAHPSDPLSKMLNDTLAEIEGSDAP